MKWPIVIRITWPGERQGVTTGIFTITGLMLFMAWNNPALWDVKLFEFILQSVVVTGLLNMIMAFHFASNKGSETARENTGKAFDAIKAAANAGDTHPDLTVKPGETAIVAGEE